MSIVAAAGAVATVTAGLEAGQIASNYVFKYTKSEYEQKITELERAYANLDEHKTNLINLRSQIPTFWKDAAGQETSRALNDTIGQTEREMQTVKKFIELFRTTVTELDESQNKISTTIDELQKLISLGIAG